MIGFDLSTGIDGFDAANPPLPSDGYVRAAEFIALDAKKLGKLTTREALLGHTVALIGLFAGATRSIPPTGKIVRAWAEIYDTPADVLTFPHPCDCTDDACGFTAAATKAAELLADPDVGLLVVMVIEWHHPPIPIHELEALARVQGRTATAHFTGQGAVDNRPEPGGYL